MIVCPVCEHSQEAGAECELCGKRFAAGTVPVAAVPRMAELEPTLHADVRALDDIPATLPDLEPTSAAAVDAVPEFTPDLEPTATAPVDVESVSIPDIERQQADLPGDGPTALPLAPVCRYCRTPAVPGERMCSRCGMRLPVIDPHLVPEGSTKVRLCTNCGSVTTRDLCPACGSRRSPGPLE
jgi:RNA polymerase subunit RPABC4/transcription elongation factor Spt4